MNRWTHLIVLRPTRYEMLSDGLTDEETRVVGEHFAYCQRLVAEGKMLLAGRTFGPVEKTIGIGIIAAESDEEAQIIVDSDPAIVNGVMTAELQPYRVALLCENPHNTN
ncbi:MAG: hypothetical protein JST12_06675 [Armatimonadetes bacterium]|nr:hypothetical protein [Armatimonadota bacterium]